MTLNAPGRITSHKDSEDSVGNALRRHKESGTQRKRSNYWANQSLSSSFNAESAQSRKLHNSPNSFSEDPQRNAK